MATSDSYIDWVGCELVERIPGKVSGRPIVRGTRILADTIVQDAELGPPVEEIQENYPDLSLTVIHQLILFALFDHNLPHKLRASLDMLGKHEAVTRFLHGMGGSEKRGVAADCGRKWL